MKTEVIKTHESVSEYVNNLDDSELVSLWNEYCQEANKSDDEIYNNDEEFFEMYFEGKVIEAIRAISFGEYRYQDEFIKFNGYGNLVTFNNPVDEIDVDELINAIFEEEFTAYDIELVEPEEEE